MKSILRAQSLLLPPNQRKGSTQRSIKGLLSKMIRRGKSKINIDLFFIAINLVISRTLQNIMLREKRKDCLHCQKPRSEEKYVFTSIDTSAIVEGIRIFRLLQNSGHFIDLIDTFVVPTFRHNLLSVSTLEKFGYNCTFGNRKKYQVWRQYYYRIVTYIVTPSNLILHTSMRGRKL